ncbi:hypothetical protein V6N11_025782 [Hibiscus sabdariffa]|uniref:Uncharacterized protein n=1 Tax=Hibiscus sabdariffa TaxID=183260 RepID=A0ABR2SUJ1_9ROSI
MVQYERLPNFFFFFGIIDHDTEHFLFFPKGVTLEFQFGPWLKVDFAKLNHDSARRSKPGIVLTKKGIAATNSTGMYRAKGTLTIWSNRNDREKSVGTRNPTGNYSKRSHGHEDGESP